MIPKSMILLSNIYLIFDIDFALAMLRLTLCLLCCKHLTVALYTPSTYGYSIITISLLIIVSLIVVLMI